MNEQSQRLDNVVVGDGTGVFTGIVVVLVLLDANREGDNELQEAGWGSQEFS